MTPRSSGALALALAAALLGGSLGATGLWSGAERSLVDAALRGGGPPDALAVCARWVVRAGVVAWGPSEAAARAGFVALALAAALALAFAAHRALRGATGAWTLVAYVTLPLVLSTARHATTPALAQAVFTALFAVTIGLHAGRDSAARVGARWLCRAALVAVAWGTARGGEPTDLAAALEALGHALFPWTGLAAFAACALAASQREGAAVERAVCAEVFVALVALLAWQVLRGGDATPLLAAPLALALGLLLDRGSLDRASLWLALLVTVVQARDLALYPRPFAWPAGAAPPTAMHDGSATLAAFVAGELSPARYALAALAGCAPAFVLGLCGARRVKVALVAGALFAALCFSRGAERAWGHALSSSEAWRALRVEGAAREPIALLGRGEEATPALFASASLPRWRDAEAASSWLGAGGRRWLVVEAPSLAALNRAQRAATGRNVSIAGGRAEGWLLATSHPTGRVSENPLDEVVSGERVRVPAGARVEALREAHFGDALVLEGVDLRVRGALRPGATVDIGQHLRVLRPLAEERVFVHVDGPCARINADHDPAGGRYPTSLWLAGDHVRDGYSVTIPWYCPRGRYAVWVGFFRGDARMPVTSGPRDDADRVLAATLDLR